MLSMLKRKRVRVALVGIAALVFAAGAFAYFTASGAGTGNAQVGNASAMTITATITPGTGGLVPGGNNAAVAFNVNNPSSGNQYVATVSLTGVQAYSDAAHTINITGTGAGKCDTSQFTMAPVTENQDVPSGSTALGTNGALVFHDSNTNQDGCQGAYLVASFSSN
jgi:hypothetical protein